MAVSGVSTGAGSGMVAGMSTSGRLAPGKSAFDQVFEDFEKLALESPIERLKDAILKSHHLTQAQYDAMSGPQKDAITSEIQTAIKRSLTGNQDAQADKGVVADLQG